MQRVPVTLSDLLWLVLVRQHETVADQRLGRPLRRPVGHEVKRVQPPVERLSHDNSGEADVAVDLRAPTAPRTTASATLMACFVAGVTHTRVRRAGVAPFCSLRSGK